MMHRLALSLVLLAALASVSDAALAEAGRLAFVQPDGTLKVGNRTIRLYAIHIPPTDRVCRTFLQPARCAPRAVLQLERMVHGFVWCDAVHGNPDGTVSAVCRVRKNDSRLGSRRDLAAELLLHGWAVALPGAPFEYITLERIARAHGRGVWGFQADSVTFR